MSAVLIVGAGSPGAFVLSARNVAVLGATLTSALISSAW